MANTICNNIASHLETLTATNDIVDSFGATLSFGSNLYINFEPDSSSNTITIYTLPGASPDSDGHKQIPGVQIRVKADSRSKTISTSQAIINTLHMEQLSGAGQMIVQQSAPRITEVLDGDNFFVSPSEFLIYIPTKV